MGVLISLRVRRWQFSSWVGQGRVQDARNAGPKSVFIWAFCKVEIEEVGIHFRGQKIGKVHEDTSVDDMINMKKASLKGHLQHGKRVD